MANWSELHQDIVALIVKQLIDVEDIARFCCVCKPWNYVAIEQKKQCLNQGYTPWLMLTKRVNDNIEDKGRVRSCYSLSSKRLFNLELPEAQRRRCWGTPYGWLVTIGVDLNIHLLHPMTREQISLPSQPTFPYQYKVHVPPKELCQYYIKNFALASNPSSWGINTSTTTPRTLESSSLVMAIYGEFRSLAIAYPGDQVWTSVQSPPKVPNDDIIFFNGHFYVISYDGVLLLCEDVNTTQPKTTLFASPPDDIDDIDRFYLVDLSGDLHLLARHFEGIKLNEYHYETKWFFVYKFNFLTKKWTEVEDLGDHALFVGNNTSFAISTSKFPEFKSSCIYFTDDHTEYYTKRFCDMGVYDTMEETIEPFYVDNDRLSRFSRSFFFMPTF
ncbi:hypothetical protein AQUCO_00700014v1 [Aquilegia coerulea]|uniref:KIB1-4 beta-propeller domain-containing protein n=1 Tax=Aquilegia coerulea TaxID=218851 RepID=A0A2G5EI67_AQUCA|nr:hypothetical protein AQUCO_00700014v1 [Aquilegia coerulea]